VVSTYTVNKFKQMIFLKLAVLGACTTEFGNLFQKFTTRLWNTWLCIMS